MTTRNDTRTGSTFLAFMLGSAIGIGAGLLFAPKSGQENREQLKQKMYAAKDKMRDQTMGAKEMVQMKASQAVDTVKGTTAEAKQGAKDTIERTNARLNESRTA